MIDLDPVGNFYAHRPAAPAACAVQQPIAHPPHEHGLALDLGLLAIGLIVGAITAIAAQQITGIYILVAKSGRV